VSFVLKIKRAFKFSKALESKKRRAKTKVRSVPYPGHSSLPASISLIVPCFETSDDIHNISDMIKDQRTNA
jgi:hypothetical protein